MPNPKTIPHLTILLLTALLLSCGASAGEVLRTTARGSYEVVALSDETNDRYLDRYCPTEDMTPAQQAECAEAIALVERAYGPCPNNHCERLETAREVVWLLIRVALAAAEDGTDEQCDPGDLNSCPPEIRERLACAYLAVRSVIDGLGELSRHMPELVLTGLSLFNRYESIAEVARHFTLQQCRGGEDRGQSQTGEAVPDGADGTE